MLHLLLALGLGSPAIAAVQADPLEQACRAPAGDRPELAGIVLSDQPAGPGDLPAIRATSTATGAHMLVYYDAISEAAARARAACLGAQLALLEREVGDDRRDAEWDSVVFTADRAYAPPRADAARTRWPVHTSADGGLDDAAHTLVVHVMPHEQVHEYQTRAGARLPRWFAEGHATWVGLKVEARLDPESARAEILKNEADLSGAVPPLDLAGWGGMQVKPEAVLRQLSPEDRARKLADPSFQPSGTFRFGPDDLISDESNTSARYAGAWKVFVGLEQRHGADAVKAWVAEVTASSERLTPAALVASAQARFGEDIAPLLR